MSGRLAGLLVRRRWLVLAATAVLLGLSGAVGGSVPGLLSVGGYTDPGSESTRAAALLAEDFRAGEPNLVLLISDRRGVDSPATGTAAQGLLGRLSGEPGVQRVDSYWSLGRPAQLRDPAGRQAVALVRLAGDDDAVTDVLARLRPRYHGSVDGLTVRFGGTAEINQELTDQSQQDLARAEAIIFPVTLVVLVLVFGGLVAALLPLLLAVVILLGTLLVLRVLTEAVPVSVFAMNVATGLGLGLAIDYSLLVVTRYREELAGGAGTRTALATTLRTAGRSVLFSAVVVALALSGLLFFPFYFLRSFAYAGIPTTLLAAAASVTVLPALLAVLGPRIDRWRIRRPGRRPEPGTGFWFRLGHRVMRRPLPVLLAGVAILLLLGAPFRHLRITLPDERVLPPRLEAAEVGEVLRGAVDGRESRPLLVVAPGLPADRTADVAGYARRLSGLGGVGRVDSAAGSFARGQQVAPATAASARFGAAAGTYFSVVPAGDPLSAAARQVVRDVRGAPAPVPVLVAGDSAELVDAERTMLDTLPLVFLVVALSLFVMLFLLTGSIVVPVKALVLNALSLSATFGALVWVFQEGHLRGLLGDFTVTGGIVWSVPMLLFCITFGLSMDYEVFLLSRIKEEYDRGAGNTAAVAAGLERTGRLITAAATLMAIVFLSFASSGIVSLKEIGLGLAIAVVVDATLVRALLVPALMRLMGRANWWAPGPLRVLHRRIGLSEGDVPPNAATGDRATALSR